jgi:hypothetical protein
MGTSPSKGDALAGSALIPPWANEDPVLPSEHSNPASNDDNSTPTEEDKPRVTPAPSPLVPPAPFRSFRGDLRRYVETGDRGRARSALGHWANSARGGARSGTQRLSRAIRSGGGALAALARSGAGASPSPDELDIRGLAGLPSEIAIAQIVDAF